MKLPISLLFFVASMATSLLSYAQLPWFNALPMYDHPSFAGSQGKLRFNSNSELLVHGKKTGEFFYIGKETASINQISFDGFLKKIHCGVGGGVKYLSEKSNTLFSISPVKYHQLDIQFALAPKISFLGKYSISPSIELTESLVNQFDIISVQILSDTVLTEINYSYKKNQFNCKAGLLFNSAKTFFGGGIFSTRSLANNRGFEYQIPFKNKIYFLAGHTFAFGAKANFTFTPVIMYGTNKDYIESVLSSPYNRRYSNIFLNARYKKLIAGVSLYKDFMLGFQSSQFRIMATAKYGMTNEYFFKKIPANTTSVNYLTVQISLKYLFSKSGSLI